jgi:hypothetical protein
MPIDSRTPANLLITDMIRGRTREKWAVACIGLGSCHACSLGQGRHALSDRFEVASARPWDPATRLIAHLGLLASEAESATTVRGDTKPSAQCARSNQSSSRRLKC